MFLHHKLRAAGGSGSVSSITDIRTEIADIASVLATNRTTYTGRITNVYYYDQDGYTGTTLSSKFITDGEYDMYDNANFTSPWLGSIPSTGTTLSDHPNAIDYSTTSATTAGSTTWAATGYTQMTPYYYGNNTTSSASDVGMPNTVVGSTGNSSAQYSGWMKGGDSGADGNGTRTWRTLYTGSTINGFTVYAGDASTYGTGDPGHCDLYISLGHTNWNSSFGGTSPSIGQPSTGDGASGTRKVSSWLGVNSTSQNNIVHIAMLLAKRDMSTGINNNGQQPTSTELQNIVSDVTSHLKTHFGY